MYGIEYIVERSTDLRIWIQYDNSNPNTNNGIAQVDLKGAVAGKGVDTGRGMERVHYEL